MLEQHSRAQDTVLTPSLPSQSPSWLCPAPLMSPNCRWMEWCGFPFCCKVCETTRVVTCVSGCFQFTEACVIVSNPVVCSKVYYGCCSHFSELISSSGVVGWRGGVWRGLPARRLRGGWCVCSSGSPGEFCLPHPYSALYLFNFSHSSGCVALAHCAFNLHLADE